MINMIKQMARRRIRSAALGLLLMGISLPMASSSFAAEVLLLADEDSVGTIALDSALTTDGHTVTRLTPEYSWDGTLTGYDCVVHLDGSQLAVQFPLPVSAQQALENFVGSGQGGFIGSQWNAYEFTVGQQVAMPNLVLQRESFGAGQADHTYTVVAGQENHAVLTGIPVSFMFWADAHDLGPAASFANQPSTVLMIGIGPWGEGPGVIVREFGDGRVVNFNHAANFMVNPTFHDPTLQDPIIQQLYLNAVAWACPSTVVPEPVPDTRNETKLQIWKARVKLNHKKDYRDKFKVEGFFEAFTNGDGTDHLPGDVTVTLQGFSQMIEAEYLVREKKHFTYRGRSRDGSIARLTIRDDGRFKVVGKHLNLQDLVFNEAVAFSIQMGPDYGEAWISLDHEGRLRDKYEDKDDDDDDDRDDDDDDDDDDEKKDDDDDDDDDD